jgi:hypothetical protein
MYVILPFARQLADPLAAFSPSWDVHDLAVSMQDSSLTLLRLFPALTV